MRLAVIFCLCMVVLSPGYARAGEAGNAQEIESLRVLLEQEERTIRQLQVECDRIVAQARQEKAKLYAELGAAYIKAKMFDPAIKAYEALVALEPKNYQGQYALGLLYKQHKNDSIKAVAYLKQYLVLAPKTKDRADIEYLVRMLEAH